MLDVHHMIWASPLAEVLPGPSNGPSDSRRRVAQAGYGGSPPVGYAARVGLYLAILRCEPNRQPLDRVSNPEDRPEYARWTAPSQIDSAKAFLKR